MPTVVVTAVTDGLLAGVLAWLSMPGSVIQTAYRGYIVRSRKRARIIKAVNDLYVEREQEVRQQHPLRVSPTSTMRWPTDAPTALPATSDVWMCWQILCAAAVYIQAICRSRLARTRANALADIRSQRR